MKFKKIDESKFQCLLMEEDLEENNISLDDFFRNDTNKIHSLLDVIMQEAQKSIGVVMDKGVMSLQLAPQPNKSLLLTISTGTEDFNDMLKQAGERASQVVSALMPDSDSNIIKNGSDENMSAVPFEAAKDIESESEKNGTANSGKKNKQNNVIKAATLVFEFESIEDIEEFCMICPKTWGINNSLYKDCRSTKLFLILEKGRCSNVKYKYYTELLIEYAKFIASGNQKVCYIHEHCEPYILKNAINTIKKYCEYA